MVNIFTRNNALNPPKGYTISNVNIFDRITSIFKWEVWAALSKSEVLEWYYSTPKWARKLEYEEGVNHDFSMIHEKDKIIKLNLEKIKFSISEKWWIKDKILYELAISYRNLWLISNEDIENCFNNYIIKRAKDAIHIIKSPLYTDFWKKWNKIKVQNHHDIDFDLNDTEKTYLAYCVMNNLLSQEEITTIENILKKWWDTLSSFLDKYSINLNLTLN